MLSGSGFLGLGNILFQNVLDKGVRGLPLIHSIAHEALVRFPESRSQ